MRAGLSLITAGLSQAARTIINSFGKRLCHSGSFAAVHELQVLGSLYYLPERNSPKAGIQYGRMTCGFVPRVELLCKRYFLPRLANCE